MHMNPSAAAAQPQWAVQRRWPRFPVSLCVKVSVSCKGSKQTVYGRSIEVAIGGMSCYVPIELLLCEKLEMELILPDQPKPLKVQAVVRNHRGHRYGMEFSSLEPTEQEQLLNTCKSFLRLNQL